MINLKSGAIDLDDGVHIDSQMGLEAAMMLPNAKKHHSVAGQTQISLGPHLSSNATWGVGIVFIQNSLKQIWLQCLIERADLSDLLLEKERKAIHDRILEELCKNSGQQRKQIGYSIGFDFSWGKISSILDMRGVQALIVVEYRGG